MLNGVELLRARLPQYADEIDGGFRIPQGMGDRIWIAQIGLHRMNLPDLAERLQMKREIGAAHGDPDPPAALRQGAHHMPADKARTAKDRHKPVCSDQFIRHFCSSLSEILLAVVERFGEKWNCESTERLRFILTNPATAPHQNAMPRWRNW